VYGIDIGPDTACLIHTLNAQNALIMHVCADSRPRSALCDSVAHHVTQVAPVRSVHYTVHGNTAGTVMADHRIPR